jgi:PAS domain S-box-containing protein
MNRLVKASRRRIIAQVVVPAFFSVALLIIGYRITVPSLQLMLINERKQMAAEMVNSMYNLMEGYNEQVKKGEMTLSEAQTLVINSVKYQRYGKQHANYFWIQNFEGLFIYHPYFKNGLKEKVTPKAQKTAMMMTQLAQKQNEGFVTYNWTNPAAIVYTNPKEAYIKAFKPWGWIVGTGFLLADIKAEMQQMVQRITIILVDFLGALIVILIFILFRNYRNLQKILQKDTKLKQSDIRFRGFAQNIPIGLAIFENGSPAFVNEQFCAIFGIEKLLDFDIQQFLPGWEKERVKILMAAAPVNQKREFETWIQLPDQVKKYVGLRFSYDFSALIDYTYLIVDDLTEQKQNLTTLDVLSETLKQSPAAILITDLQGVIEYINPNFEKVSGYTYEEIIGMTPRILKSNKMPEIIYEDLWKTISQGKIWKGELLNKKKDGSLFWESTVIFPIKNHQNEIIKYSSIKTDITYNKQIEQELLAAKDKAEENERLKSAFLNNISHEVRTPLNAVYGFTQLLKAHFSTNDEVFNHLKTIEQNCQILLRLFEDIIDFSSVESRSVTLYKEDVLLHEVLLKLVSKYNTQLTVTEIKPVEIVVDADNNFDTMILFTDRKRITQIFDKLISNAIKFTVEGQVTISYNIFPEYIEFHISDTGVGIPDAEKESIFDSFSHGGKMFVGLHKGVGLGLNMVKLLVELLGGKLSYASVEEKGTTFTFSFPTIDLKNYTLHGNRVIDYSMSLSGKNILVAEDNDENFLYIEALLSSKNNIIRAKTGLEAVNVAKDRHTHIDIILMDVLMPELDGITAAKMIRKILPKVPILAVTAVGSTLTDPENGVFDAILLKPIKGPDLVQKTLEVYETKKKESKT